MREILFRGKQKENDEWAYGFLVSQKHIGDWVTAYPVDPNTVGQFTGLTDKNGKKIFEGDIVRYFQRLFSGEDYEQKDPVLFLDGGFTVGVCFLDNWLRDWSNGNIRLEEIEVIGNIHDNPELLGGDGNAI